MLNSMTFNGIKKPNIYLLEGREKAPFAPITRTIITTRNGHRLKNNKRELLSIFQPIGYVVQDDLTALGIKDELAEWLVTDDIAPLQFDDEPGRTYWCVVQNSINDLRRLANTRSGTIHFLCFYTTGQRKSLNITNTPTTFNITGQDKTDWEINVVFSVGTNEFEIITDSGLYLLLQYNFIQGDRLTIKYEGREVWLNGVDLRSSVRLKTNFEMLRPGPIEIASSHDCELTYDERFY